MSQRILLVIGAFATIASACSTTPATPPEGVSGTHTGTPESGRCYTCHQVDYEGAHHHPGERFTTCGVCHSQEGWRPLQALNHAWEITGAHTEAECADCHEGSPTVFVGTPEACVGCHRDDEAQTFAAHHQFGSDCASCHTTEAWHPAQHPPPPPIPDAGPPDAFIPPDAYVVTRRRVRRPTTTTMSTTPTPDPPPDTTTRASSRW